jgi:taurine dioxygenase
MKVVPLAGSIGAELQDVDLTAPLDEDEIGAMRGAFAEHHVIIVRGQQFDGDGHDRYVQYLGPLETFDNGARVQYMTNKANVENAAGAASVRLLFHNDGAFRQHPRAATSLYAIEVSPTSPPTSFANAVRAYESLPADLQERVSRLHAVNLQDLGDPDNESERLRVADLAQGRTLDDLPHATHPVVITVPHSGRKALFVSEFHTSHIAELGPDSDEGEELLQRLFAVLYAEDNTYAHHYANGDVVIWDNMSVQHARSGAVDSSPRHLRRLVVKTTAW